MFDTTIVHGRFQPFHLGHFDYVKLAYEITNFHLIIGITNPTPELTREEFSDGHRHLKDSNPFTYYQRYMMITKSIKIDPYLNNSNKQISVVPFPIHDEKLWLHFIPKRAVHIMSVFEEWDVEKKKRFLKFGFKVHELNCKRLVSGKQVRKLIKSHSKLDEVVPQGTLNLLSRLEFYE